MDRSFVVASLLVFSTGAVTPSLGQALPGESCAANGGTNCPAVIPDGPGGVLISTFGFDPSPECNNSFISDVNIGIDISHTRIGDLDIVVSGPVLIPLGERGPGPDVVLFDRDCGSADDMRAIWDDQGSPHPCPPIGFGRFLPVEPLAEMNDFIVPETWELAITDNAGGDIGTLEDWSVEVTCEWGACCLDNGGCVETNSFSCTFDLNGEWQGHGTTCNQVQCGVPTMAARWLGILLLGLLALGLSRISSAKAC